MSGMLRKTMVYKYPQSLQPVAQLPPPPDATLPAILPPQPLQLPEPLQLGDE